MPMPVRPIAVNWPAVAEASPATFSVSVPAPPAKDTMPAMPATLAAAWPTFSVSLPSLPSMASTTVDATASTAIVSSNLVSWTPT